MYPLEEIKKDLLNMDEKLFFSKYFLETSENWYFENILRIQKNDIEYVTNNFKNIISKNLGIRINNIFMVGSSKIGYSLSPAKNILREFRNYDEEEEGSDIDIAIISSELFHQYWDLFRKFFELRYNYIYQYISRAIFRGFINEYDLQRIGGCRKEWNLMAGKSKQLLQNELYFQHKISYRIYRNWQDMEEYHIQSLRIIKGAFTNGTFF